MLPVMVNHNLGLLMCDDDDVSRDWNWVLYIYIYTIYTIYIQFIYIYKVSYSKTML